VLKSYKYRIYPTKEQSELLDKHFNACRFAYNLALETKIRAYKEYGVSLSAYDLQKQLTSLKKDNKWLCLVDSQSLQRAISNMDNAYKVFFRGGGYPKFKSKHRGLNTFGSPHGKNIKIVDNLIKIPKFREGINIKVSRPLLGEIRQAAVSKTPTGKYFISILVDTGVPLPDKKPILQDTAVGIDLGIKTFAVLSNDEEIANPKYLTAATGRLAILQRRVSKKKKGSANRRKANLKVALLHEKISNQRKDFLHKFSTSLINNHDTICLEDLNIKGMVHNHKLARSISDASWSEFNRQLEYKADWYGKNIIRIGRFEPSSKTCNVCGLINMELTLLHREWTCECGITHDRDFNAAINIRNIGLSGRGTPAEPLELPTLVGAKKKENIPTPKQTIL
jgi:putative transposase